MDKIKFMQDNNIAVLVEIDLGSTKYDKYEEELDNKVKNMYNK